jgi:hypothetical protein
MKSNSPNNYYCCITHPGPCLTGNWVISGRGMKSFSPVQLQDTGTLFTGLKRMEREAHYLPLFRSEVEKCGEVYLHFLLPHTSTSYGV